MERFEDYNTYILGTIGAATIILFYFLLRSDPEAAVPYNVTPPEQIKPGWEGEVLEDPSMKVGFSIHLYDHQLTATRSQAPH